MKYKYKWLIQKVAALVFLLSFFVTVKGLQDIDLYQYENIYNFINGKFNAFIIFLLVSSILIHSNIGLSSIIDDYIHDSVIKNRIVTFKNFLLVLLFIMTILSILIIVL